MNRSGLVLRYSPLASYDADDIILVCDTLDLPPGHIRIKIGGSSAGHNGLKSIIEHLGDSNFIRVYVGIGRPTPPQTVVDYVLKECEGESEKAAIQHGITLATKAVVALINGTSVLEVSRAYNRKVTHR